LVSSSAQLGGEIGPQDWEDVCSLSEFEDQEMTLWRIQEVGFQNGGVGGAEKRGVDRQVLHRCGKR
jgi:hypothetical protein